MSASISTFPLAQQIHALETSFLRPEVRRAARLAELLAEDFVEFGSSGHIFSREEVLRSLPTEPAAPRSVDDMRVTPLGEDAVLVSYRAWYDQQPRAESLRSSVWVHRDGRWQLRFHQGTPCPGAK